MEPRLELIEVALATDDTITSCGGCYYQGADQSCNWDIDDEELMCTAYDWQGNIIGEGIWKQV